MSSGRRRYDALRATLQGSVIYGGSISLRQVDHELQHLDACSRVTGMSRRHLLQVIHSTRALDTAINVILSINAVPSQKSLGKMFTQLASLPAGASGRIPPAMSHLFRTNIANVRNKYAHEANKFPASSKEVDKLVAEIHTCLVQILR